MPNEEWRPVTGYEGLYEVSNLGRVKSCEKIVMSRHGTPRKNPQPERLMKLQRKVDGYFGVALAKEGKKKNRKVHRLVCEAFHGPCPKGMECAHSDGNRQNNRADNLSWKFPVDNMADQVRHGTRVKGEKTNTAKLSAHDVCKIRRLHQAGAMGVDLAAQFGVHKSTISLITTGRNWAHI